MKISKGVIFLTFSAFLYALTGVFSRYLSGYFDSLSLNIYRGVVGCLILFPLAIKNWVQINRRDIFWLGLYGISSPLSFLFFYVSTIHITIGLTLFLFYSSALIMGFLLGKVLLHEKLTRNKIFALFLSFVGLIIIGYPHLTSSSFYVLVAIVSGVLYGVVNACSRKVSKTYSSSQLNFINYFVSLILFIPLWIYSGITFPHVSMNVPFVTATAFTLVSISALFLLINGFKQVEVQVGSIILLSEIVFGIVFGIIFFKEIPTLSTIIGGSFIIVSLALPHISKRNT